MQETRPPMNLSKTILGKHREGEHSPGLTPARQLRGMAPSRLFVPESAGAMRSNILSEKGLQKPGIIPKSPADYGTDHGNAAEANAVRSLPDRVSDVAVRVSDLLHKCSHQQILRCPWEQMFLGPPQVSTL